MITGRQVRAARAFLGWDAEELAEKAKISRDTVFNIENGDVQARGATIDKIIRAFDSNGIEFLADDGVRRRKDSVTTLEGHEDFISFMDQVYEAAKEPSAVDGGKPICICNLDNRLFRQHMGERHAMHVERLSKIEGLQIRSLAALKDKEHVSRSTYLVYRYLVELRNVANQFYVFGDKFALIDFAVENPPRILLINSAQMAQSYRKQFEVMWSNAAASPAY